MKTSFVSNQAIQNAMRLTMRQAQAEVMQSQREIVTGKHADFGDVMGSTISRNIKLNTDVERMKSLMVSNSLVELRMSGSQEALSQISEGAQMMLDALISSQSADDDIRVGSAVNKVKEALDIFTDSANTSIAGEFVFSGINTDVVPIAEYTAGSPAKVAFDAAFMGHFGFAQTSPSTVGITVTQMDDFITNVLEPMYTGANWTSDWSGASDQSMKSRISKSEVIDSSATSNEDGMRKFGLAAIMSIELLQSGITPDVRASVNSKAIVYAGDAITGVDTARSSLGLSESRVKSASDSMQLQINIATKHISSLEDIDPYEASTRMNTLLSQVEIAYNLTSRIQRLSLMSYLR